MYKSMEPWMVKDRDHTGNFCQRTGRRFCNKCNLNLAWGAIINCSPIPDPCNGATGNSDTMTANDGSNSGQYTINGLAGSDTILATETGSFGQGLNINGGDNNDKITAKRTGGVGTFANGDSGNHILRLVVTILISYME